ncbi:MAG: hypothetical protein H6733_12655 [Alphaproteobacteria bacterium]|nr:hypothetical protein [Alphaproteobacteria bacterium]
MRVADDMEALARIFPRPAGSEQERDALDAVRARLPDPDAARVEGFAGHTAPWAILGIHGVCLFVAGVLGFWFPRVGALGCLLATASLVGEGSGRLGLLRLWLPKLPSYNLVVPHEVERAVGTVVFTTPLDVPRVHLRRPRWMRRPLLGVFVSSSMLTVLLVLRSLSEPWGTPLLSLYLACLVVQGVTSAVVFATWRAPRAVSNDTGGMAALLELERRLAVDPIPGLCVWTVFTGCGRAHQDGIRAFLTLRGERQPAPLLVISLEEAGRAPLAAALTEGPLWRQHHLPTGPALVERLQWAGVRVPTVDRAEASDARAAMLLGFRALSLVGGDGVPDPDHAARAADVVETVARWFAADLQRVADTAKAPGLTVTPSPVDELSDA